MRHRYQNQWDGFLGGGVPTSRVISSGVFLFAPVNWVQIPGPRKSTRDWLTYMCALHKGRETPLLPVSQNYREQERGPRRETIFCYRIEEKAVPLRPKQQMVNTDCEPGPLGNLFLAYACHRWGQHPQRNWLSRSQALGSASKLALVAENLFPSPTDFISVSVTCSQENPDLYLVYMSVLLRPGGLWSIILKRSTIFTLCLMNQAAVFSWWSNACFLGSCAMDHSASRELLGPLPNLLEISKTNEKALVWGLSGSVWGWV